MANGYKIDKGFMWVREPNIPAEYQEVEWIQSSGTQYINTGWCPTSNYCKVVTNMTFEGGVHSTTAVFFGMAASGVMYSLHKNPNWQINAGSSGNINIGTYSNGNLDVEYTVNNRSYSLKLGGNTYSGSYSGSVAQSTNPMYIFVFDESGSTTWRAYAKLYSFKIYSDANTLARDFVPCYRKSDNVIGMYDMVEGKFYANSGTGTFSKGNDVAPTYIFKEKQFYPFTGWRPGANTIAYYPLKEDVLDYSGNGNNGSGNPNSFTDGVANYSGNSTTLPTSLAQSIPLTCLIWINDNGVGVGEHNLAAMGQHTYQGYGLCLPYNQHNSSGYYVGWFTGSNSGNPTTVTKSYNSLLSGWHLMGFTRDGTTLKLYIDGQLESQNTDNSYTSNATFYLGYDHGYDGGAWIGKMSELIFEDKARTAQEISDYYNQTKSNYGL